MVHTPPDPAPVPLAQGQEEAFVHFGRKELARRTKKLLSWRQHVLKNEEREAVHQMRVASRRLRATLSAYRSIAHPKALEQAYQQVTQVARRLGTARDADVLLQHVEILLSQLASAEQAGGRWLLDRLSGYRTRQQQQLEAFLRKLDAKALTQVMTRCLPKKTSSTTAHPRTEQDHEAPTHQQAQILVRTRLEEMAHWSEQANAPYAVKELHELRLAAKQLRYTLELFQDVLPQEWAAVGEEVAAIQEELGALHDSDVLIALLRLCLSLQDNPDYARLLSRVQHAKGSVLKPALVASVLDPSAPPTALERAGLEQFLHKQERLREEQYSAFQAHWSRLQEQGFPRQMLDLLEENARLG